MQNTCLRILASLVAALPMFGADPSQSARRIFDKQLTAAEGEVMAIVVENLQERLNVPSTGDQLQRLSETLNAMLSRLELSVRRIKQFTADASHELRAPVSLIRTTAEVAVQKRDRPAGEYLEALDEILQEAERTSQVVDSMMLLARADSGKEIVESGSADFCEVVREAAEQGEKLARSHGVQFRVDLPDGTCMIRGDSEALRRAILILIDNAAKYTPAGGSITVRLNANNGVAVATVTDTGIGIAKEDRAHIFDRFWRADRARSREQGGAGLGLSIAKWIVEMHQGSIDVKSEPAKGPHLRFVCLWKSSVGRFSSPGPQISRIEYW
jgi:signal transduction histidine kinase